LDKNKCKTRVKFCKLGYCHIRGCVDCYRQKVHSLCLQASVNPLELSFRRIFTCDTNYCDENFAFVPCHNPSRDGQRTCRGVMIFAKQQAENLFLNVAPCDSKRAWRIVRPSCWTRLGRNKYHCLLLPRYRVSPSG